MSHSKVIRVAVIAAAFVLVGCGGSDTDAGSADSPSPTRELVDSNDVLSDSARYGDLVFTSGFLGLEDGGDFDADVNNALDQLEVALGRSGAGFDTILKVNVYLADMDNWEAYDAIFQERIGDEFGRPPRTTVEVARLALDAPIEIAAIAHVRPPAP